MKFRRIRAMRKALRNANKFRAQPADAQFHARLLSETVQKQPNFRIGSAHPSAPAAENTRVLAPVPHFAPGLGFQFNVGCQLTNLRVKVLAWGLGGLAFTLRKDCDNSRQLTSLLSESSQFHRTSSGNRRENSHYPNLVLAAPSPPGLQI